ncbi:MAG TPA: hypothetical protein VLV18_01915 [Terriglobales bacterium]|nr:hypothetical protein [Terriglobales bacterium]
MITEVSATRDQRNLEIEENIAASVEEALDDLLGTPVVEAFYAYLLEIGVSRNNLADKVKLLCSALDSTFEESSLTIQRAIAQRLFAKLGMPFTPVESISLLEYIKIARKQKRV